MASVAQRTEEVNKRMNKAGLSRVAPAVLKLLLPSIRLIVEERSEEPVTRLGGTPNMPAEISWPTRRSGDPHSFLAQIDLGRLEICDGLPLPHHGALFFFCDAEYLPDVGDPLDVSDGIKVIYSPTSLSKNGLRTPPRELNAAYIFEGLSLQPRLDVTAPAQDVWEIESLHLSDAESYAYGDLFGQVCAIDESVHRMGGHPNLLQYGRLNRNGDNGGADWLLLLQLDSESEAGMMWGDQGRLYFTIRERDLRSSRFEEASMGWQCG